MKLITTTHSDGTAIIKLNRGVTNALDLELIVELAETLQITRDDPKTHSVVLSSTNDKFLSIGFDIPQLFSLPRKDLETFYHVFNQACLKLFTLLKPTVAAITGHAIAGGCILALCCDYRFMADGRKLMGLNEIKLGVPVPYLADCVLKNLVGVRAAREIMERGEFYSSGKAVQIGMVDQVLPLEQVLSKSIETARELGFSPHKAFEIIKRNRIEIVEAQVLARLEEKEQSFIDCWYSSEARDRLREAIKKFSTGQGRE
jgi:enoyl-CoA hydratase/carnithine racemase